MDKKLKKVIVIAPTYNEKSSIEKVTQLILNQEGKVPGFVIHVLVVDSNSPDGTSEVAKKMAEKNSKIHFLNIYERGLGLAIVSGYRYALDELDADVLMQIDADLQHDPNEIPLFLQKISEGYNYVQGSRYVTGGSNNISLMRRVFSKGASFTCRLLTGVWNIQDFMPSYKAYTRELFLKMNWDAVPWQGTTFLVQPAAVVEAYRAGAKMVEVPIRFQDRRADRSKNETVNYIIDVIGYGIEVRLSKMGINFPALKWARRSKTFIKFGTVGLVGTMIDFLFYNIFIGSFGFKPATSKGISTEIAILNNFALNNAWTFKKRKTKNTFWKKIFIFNIVSLGGLVISVTIVKMLHSLYGDGLLNLGILKLQYYNIYFFFTIPPVLMWNFLVNNFITWRKDLE